MISHSNVTEQIIQYFKDNITSGKWNVGEKIPSENQLTEQLGVSRASIRTAIQHFVGLGILESRHGKGTFLLDDQVDEQAGSKMKVTAEDCRNIHNVLEFRRIVESEACYLATRKTTPQLLEELENSLKEMHNNVGKSEAFVTADLRFHVAVCRASQNPILEKSLVKVFAETKKNHQQMNMLFGYKDGIHYHTLILEAIREEDAAKARELMFDHMQYALDRLSRIKRENR